MADFVERCPSPRTFTLLEHAHGAVARVASEAIAFPTRQAGLDFVIFSLWQNAEDDRKNSEWTRNFFAAMRRWSAGSVYVNALTEDDAGRISEAFGNNFARLSEVKAKYDPQNRFRRNQNIPPKVANRRPQTEVAQAAESR